jgi:hypothetical protein
MKIENRAISSAFKKAKKQLDACTFICNSIKKQGFDTPIVVVCKGIIKERMNYSPTLECWLNTQHGIHIFYFPKHEEEMLKYRHRWLDELIKEFDVDGYYEG